MVVGEDADGRRLVGDAAAADDGGIRTVLRPVELELVVLHDDRAAVAGVLQQPVVVRAQVLAPLVGPHAGDDDVEARQVAPGQLVGVDEFEPRAELLYRRGHGVADAFHVADRQVRRDGDVDDLERPGGRPDHVSPLDVRILDHPVAPIEPVARVLDHGAHRVLAGRRALRRHAEADRSRFVLAREPHRRRRGRRAPARGQIEGDGALRRVRPGVRDRDAHLARGAGTGGDDRDLGRHGDGEARRHLQVHPLLAGEHVVDVAVADGPLHGDADAVQLHVEGRPERSRTERQSERNVRVEGVAVRPRDAAPVNAGRPGAGRNPGAALATVHAGRSERLRAAGRFAGETGQADAADGHAGAAVVRGPQLHGDRLARRHHAVVRERVELQPLREQGGALELALLGIEAEVDLPPGRRGQPHVREPRAQVAHRPQAGHHRLARARHPRGLEPLERRARLTRKPGQRAPEPGRGILAGKAHEPFEGSVHSVEQRGFRHLPLSRNGGLGEPIAYAGRAGRQRDQLRHALALVHAARTAADLRVGGAEQRIVAAEVHRGQVRIRRRPEAEAGRTGAHPERKTDPEVELPRLPGRQPLGDLLREAVRIGGGVPRLAGEHRRRLVVLAAAAPLRRHGGDDVGADGADHPDEVAEDLLPPPALEGLFDAEGVSEVDGAAEVLLGPVEAMRRLQLLGPQHRQGVEQLGADLVLAAVAARRRQQYGAMALALRQPRQQGVVLVVGVGRDHQEGAGAVDLAQGDPERRPPFADGERPGVGRGLESAGADRERNRKRRHESTGAHHHSPSIPGAATAARARTAS